MVYRFHSNVHNDPIFWFRSVNLSDTGQTMFHCAACSNSSCTDCPIVVIKHQMINGLSFCTMDKMTILNGQFSNIELLLDSIDLVEYCHLKLNHVNLFARANHHKIWQWWTVLLLYLWKSVNSPNTIKRKHPWVFLNGCRYYIENVDDLFLSGPCW